MACRGMYCIIPSRGLRHAAVKARSPSSSSYIWVEPGVGGEAGLDVEPGTGAEGPAVAVGGGGGRLIGGLRKGTQICVDAG